MEALLHAIKLERESFVTEEKRAQQQAKDVGEQMSFF
jgi:hypothetical protein